MRIPFKLKRAWAIIVLMAVFTGMGPWILVAYAKDAPVKKAEPSKKVKKDAPKAVDKEEEAVYLAARKVHEVPIPIPERIRQMVMMAEKGDAFSVKVLKKLGDMPDSSGLQMAAIDTLGLVKNPVEKPLVATYLEKKMGDRDLGIRCSAISGYGKLLNEAAVPRFSGFLKEYRTKKVERDELESIRAVSVRALSRIGSKEAIKALESELSWLGRNLHESFLDHGSQLCASLNQVGSVESRACILVYLDRLKVALPQNPSYKEMFEEKIAETQKLVGIGEKKPASRKK